jgi:hypothetical protein
MDDLEKSLRAGLRRAFESAGTSAERRELYSASLDGHSATGVTTHRRDGRILPKPASLVIAQTADQPGFYLVYLDEAGEEMTNTYHDDLERAFAQAKAEFGVGPAEWSSGG